MSKTLDFITHKTQSITVIPKRLCFSAIILYGSFLLDN